MIATHSVKIGGKWYKAGDKLPALTPSVEEVKKPEERIYTKTDINRMPIAELKTLAASKGIESGDTMSGAELKKNLLKALGL